MFKILFASLTKYAVHKVPCLSLNSLIKNWILWCWSFDIVIISVFSYEEYSFILLIFFCYSIVWTPPLESFNFEFLFMVLIAAVLFFKIHHGECTYLQKFIALVISHSHTPYNKKRQTNSYSSIKNLIIENKTSRKKYRVSNKRIFFDTQKKTGFFLMIDRIFFTI